MAAIHTINLIAIINSAYKRIFHEEINSDIEKFVKNLSYVGIGTIVASFFSFAYNILAGRLLGPSEYGTFTLVQTVAMFLYIPMLLGFHRAMIKYNAEKVDFLRQRSIISTTYILVFLFTVASVLVYLTFSNDIMAIFSISDEEYYLAILVAILYVVYLLTTESLRSLHLIKTYSRLMPIFSGIMFFAFIYFAILCKNFTYISPLLSMLLAYGVTSGVILAILKKYLKLQLSKEWVNKLYKYSIYTVIGGITYVLYSNIDKVMINYYLSTYDVGLYRAYYYSFTTVILLISSTFVTTLLPFASNYGNKRILFQKLKKISIIFTIILYPIALISGSTILLIYGPSYHLDATHALLYSLLAIVIPVNQFYDCIMCSVGVEGVKLVSFAAILTALINIALNFILIPMAGIDGAVISTIISYAVSTMIIISGKKMISGHHTVFC